MGHACQSQFPPGGNGCDSVLIQCPTCGRGLCWLRYLPWRFGTLGSVGCRDWGPHSCPAVWSRLTECLLGRGMPLEAEVSLPSKERRPGVQGKPCGCYVGLSPGRSDSRAPSLILLLLLPKPCVCEGVQTSPGEADLTGSPASWSVTRPYVNCSIDPGLIWKRRTLPQDFCLQGWASGQPMPLGDGHMCLLPYEDQHG